MYLYKQPSSYKTSYTFIIGSEPAAQPSGHPDCQPNSKSLSPSSKCQTSRARSGGSYAGIYQASEASHSALSSPDALTPRRKQTKKRQVQRPNRPMARAGIRLPNATAMRVRKRGLRPGADGEPFLGNRFLKGGRCVNKGMRGMRGKRRARGGECLRAAISDPGEARLRLRVVLSERRVANVFRWNYQQTGATVFEAVAETGYFQSMGAVGAFIPLFMLCRKSCSSAICVIMARLCCSCRSRD